MRVLQWMYLSSLHVAVATGICAIAFFKLPDGHKIVQWIPIFQITLVCWLIYIVDRILDVTRSPENHHTERHVFHFNNQYNLQMVAIALLVINAALLLGEPNSVIFYGVALTVCVVIYLLWVVPKYPRIKDFSMPVIYLAAVVGVSFVRAESVHLSSWIIALIFAFVVFQNLLVFAFFEGKSNRKWILFLGAINIFLYILFFAGKWEYPNKLAFVFVLISLLYSLISSQPQRFQSHYRWLLDGLLFLPVFIF